MYRDSFKRRDSSSSIMAAASGLSIGVGLQLGRTQAGDIVILSLAPGGASERCGRVFQNDVILEIDGQPAGSSIFEVLSFLTFPCDRLAFLEICFLTNVRTHGSQAAEKLRGAEGTPVILKLSRPCPEGREIEFVTIHRSLMTTEAPPPPSQVT
jgi:C-terminal processing protease CtpA/Prc